MKLGLVTDCLADRSLEEAAAVCRRLGLEQVELGCGNWSPAPRNMGCAPRSTGCSRCWTRWRTTA